MSCLIRCEERGVSVRLGAEATGIRVGVRLRGGAIIRLSAEVAQLVERNLAKVEVAGSSPVFRSNVDHSMLRSVRITATWPSG